MTEEGFNQGPALVVLRPGDPGSVLGGEGVVVNPAWNHGGRSHAGCQPHLPYGILI